MINDNQNKNQRTVFSENSNSMEIISEILKKFGLEEVLEEELTKIKKGIKREVPKLVIIDRITKEIADGKITIDKAISFLQDQFKIPKETAEKIIDDIKIKLVPLTEKIVEKEESEEIPIVEKTLPKGVIPISFTEVMEKPQAATPEEKPAAPSPAAEPKIKKPIAPAIEESAPKPKRSKGPDKYRESVE